MNQKEKWDRLAYSYFNNCNQILDVGCGVGKFISLDPERIIGIDSNTTSIIFCKHKKYNVIQANIKTWTPSKSFNGIHCSHFLEHFNPSDVYTVIDRIDGLLSTYGVLVIRSPLLWSHFYDDLTHVKPYNPEAIMHYLCGGTQHSLPAISKDYRLIHLRYRWRKIKRIPFPQRTGYMLVLRKKE